MFCSETREKWKNNIFKPAFYIYLYFKLQETLNKAKTYLFLYILTYFFKNWEMKILLFLQIISADA